MKIIYLGKDSIIVEFLKILDTIKKNNIEISNFHNMEEKLEFYTNDDFFQMIYLY